MKYAIAPRRTPGPKIKIRDFLIWQRLPEPLDLARSQDCLPLGLCATAILFGEEVVAVFQVYGEVAHLIDGVPEQLVVAHVVKGWSVGFLDGPRLEVVRNVDWFVGFYYFGSFWFIFIISYWWYLWIQSPTNFIFTLNNISWFILWFNKWWHRY